MNLHYVQHVPFEHPGTILSWAEQQGYSLSRTLMYEDSSRFPQQKDFDWLIVMGGPMNVDEEDLYPWLKREKKFIAKSIKEGKVVVGICLGAQLIAAVLGGKVTKNPCKEIGWFPIYFDDEAQTMPLFSQFAKEMMVFQWHGDTFSELPQEAHCLAKSFGCEHQAFVYHQRVFGFQYHLENTAEIINDLLLHCADEVVPGAYVQTQEEIVSHPEYMEQAQLNMGKFLDGLDALYKKGEI